jgi:plastocyanin
LIPPRHDVDDVELRRRRSGEEAVKCWWSSGCSAPVRTEETDRARSSEMLDSMSYDPAEIQVEAGETVRLVVSNPGTATHEFVLGESRSRWSTMSRPVWA